MIISPDPTVPDNTRTSILSLSPNPHTKHGFHQHTNITTLKNQTESIAILAVNFTYVLSHTRIHDAIANRRDQTF